MRLIGLTGGIASGKTTVAGLLAERGAVVVDADAIARRIVQPGTAAYAAIVARFGAGVVKPDGSIDRPALAAVVFGDPRARADLNAITHPEVLRVMAEEVAAHKESDRIVVVEIPLLVEAELAGAFDHVVVVESPEEQQIDRLGRDRAMSPAEATERILAQATTDQRRAVAGTVIRNDASFGDLEAAVDRLWRALADDGTIQAPES